MAGNLQLALRKYIKKVQYRLHGSFLLLSEEMDYYFN